MQISHQYIIALGSNLGEKEEHLRRALSLFAENGCTILRETDFIYTKPEMVKAQPEFINMGALIETTLFPQDLLELIQNVEQKIGRTRSFRFGPREIDIDIVWWSGGEYQSSDLDIPHKWNNARHWVREIISEVIPRSSFQESFYKAMNVKSIKNINDFKAKKNLKEKIVMLTAYDYSMARALSKTSIDVILVGDSLGNVILGYSNTLKVTVEDMIHHGAAVRRGAPDKFTIIDMPFMSYHNDADEAVRNAGKIIVGTEAEAVKLEGGSEFLDVIKKIIRAGIPVMGHLGLMPQSLLKTGGHRLQAKTEEAKKKIIEDALRLQDAGIFSLVTEMIPSEVGAELSSKLEIPVIGIGAGPDVDGQVLVINDMLGFYNDLSPKFVRKYSNLNQEIGNAVETFSRDVRQKKYPDKNEFFVTE